MSKIVKEKINANAAAVQIFESNHLEDLKYFCEKIGEDYFDVHTASYSIAHQKSQAASSTYSYSEQESKGKSQQFSKGGTFSTSRMHQWGRNNGGSIEDSKFISSRN